VAGNLALKMISGPMTRSAGRGWNDTGVPGHDSASQDKTSGLPALPGGPKTRELLAGDAHEVVVLCAPGAPLAVHPARMAQISVAAGSIADGTAALPLPTRSFKPLRAAAAPGLLHVGRTSVHVWPTFVIGPAWTVPHGGERQPRLQPLLRIGGSTVMT
jgi:hypothetical protein